MIVPVSSLSTVSFNLYRCLTVNPLEYSHLYNLPSFLIIAAKYEDRALTADEPIPFNPPVDSYTLPLYFRFVIDRLFILSSTLLNVAQHKLLTHN